MKNIISICVATLVAMCATAQEKKPCESVRGVFCGVCADDYPALAKAQRLEGNVVCRVRLDEAGKVRAVKVLKPYNPILDEKAVEILSKRQLVFEPKRASQEVDVAVSFKLGH
ncbi:MAG: TonB family protein [Chloroherpetonaceae bacterium]